MLPYKAAAIAPVMRASALPTVCHAYLETPWYARFSVNCP